MRNRPSALVLRGKALSLLRLAMRTCSSVWGRLKNRGQSGGQGLSAFRKEVCFRTREKGRNFGVTVRVCNDAMRTPRDVEISLRRRALLTVLRLYKWLLGEK
jgi:hypothetical protein